MLNVFWMVLWYIGVFIGAYFLTAVAFLLTARLEKDADGSLIIDPGSLHYRACKKCYRWRGYKVYSREANKDIDKTHVEYYQLGLCGYFWRVFWAFVLLPIGYTILFSFQTVKAVVYAPFMFLFGYYPWPTLKSMKRYGDINPAAIEACRISFPRVGKLELKPYLVVLPALYGYVYWLYPDRTLSWSIIALSMVVIPAAILVILIAFDKVQETKNQQVVLVREYAKSAWRGVCPLLKVKSES